MSGRPFAVEASMRSSILLGCLLLGSSFAVACGSSSSPSTTKKDSGGDSATTTSDDSGTGDAATTDDSTVPTTDSGTTPTDAGGGDAAISSCNPHTGDECNLVLQNCTDSTKVCVYDGTTAMHNVCLAPSAIGGSGSGTAGTPCAKQADCDLGLFCQEKHCTPACCSGDNTPCGSGGLCNLDLTDTSGKTVYTVCTYSATCHAFKYDCPTGEYCNFSEKPDTFKCSSPSPSSAGIAQKPGGPCTYVNDCGESQACFSTTTADGGAGPGKCLLFCQLTGSPAVGTTPDGRFPANGTCKGPDGTSYGTCTDNGFGSGLGLCIP
jgi:hypothetical protein